MMVQELTEKECRGIVERASMGRLGCSMDNQPYVVPVNIAYEPDYIYAFSTFGQKIEWMRANPRVCIEIDEITKESEWVSVIANGRYQELPEPQYAAERAHARELLGKRYQWWLNALAERRTKLSDNLIVPLFFRVHVDTMTGLRALTGDENARAAAPPR